MWCIDPRSGRDNRLAALVTITAEGRTIRTNIIAGVISIIGIMVALVIVAAFGSDKAVDGPMGSSLVTTSLGTAALLETLDELGADVRQLRVPLSAEVLEDVDTLIALEVGEQFYDPFESVSLKNRVESGLTLVTSGPPNTDLLQPIIGDVPDWIPTTPLEGDSTIGSQTVVSSRFGTFQPGSGLPLVIAGDRDLVVMFAVGDGAVVMFSDTAMLANQSLGLADNAEFAVDQIGLGTVAFDEFRHGFTELGTTGLLQAAPEAWTRTAWLVGLALVVALATYGRRLGPAEPEGRTFVPSRRSLVDAVAASLRRTRSPVESTQSTRDLAIREISRRALLSPDATSEDVATAAATMLTDQQTTAVLHPSPDTVLAADAALARLRSVGIDRVETVTKETE